MAPKSKSALKRKLADLSSDALTSDSKRPAISKSPTTHVIKTSTSTVDVEQLSWEASGLVETPSTHHQGAIIPKYPTAWLKAEEVPKDYYQAISEYSHWPPLLFNFSDSSGVRQPSYFARFAFTIPITFVYGNPLDSALSNLKSKLVGQPTPSSLIQAFNASAQGHDLYTTQSYELNHEGGLDSRMYAEFERPALTLLREQFWKEAATSRGVDNVLSRVGVEGDCNESNLDLQITTQRYCETESVASPTSSDSGRRDIVWVPNDAIEWKTRQAFSHVRGLVAMVKAKEVKIGSGPNGDIYHDRRLVTGMARICVQIWEDMSRLRYGCAIISDGEQFVIFKHTAPGIMTISDVYGYHPTNFHNLGLSIQPWRSAIVEKIEQQRKEYNQPPTNHQTPQSPTSAVTKAHVWTDSGTKKQEKILLPRARPCGTGLFGAWIALALEDITNGRERWYEYHQQHEGSGEELNKRGMTRLGKGKLKDTQAMVDLQDEETEELYVEEPEGEV
ncbi:hypothetical protein L486_04415 [Kwoniella mangroviensis CBS 10435]|uniref:Uncharacterized protein n=1 Tax=Kwoniella mangroviensis CBS 10435 TaxID=1331196 RepID=A0A1B9IS66_9TREE|nr:hypothetical protein L486_04415 [Kwoniella mangroviensis CBS 10435]